MLKTRIYVLIILLFSLCNSIKSQSEETDSNRLYLGFRGSFALLEYQESNYLLNLGGLAVYNWENNLISASYNRGYTFYFQFGDEKKNYDNSQYQRYEINYGKSFRISETHKLFNRICFTASLGLSYNIFDYFNDLNDLNANLTTRATSLGIPISIGFANNIGKTIYAGFEYKLHIIQNIPRHVEFNVFFMIKII